MTISICSYNVNGIRSIIKKDQFISYFNLNNYDIVCFQETKLQNINNKETFDKIDHIFNKSYKYKYYSNCICKNGYSGVSIFSKIKPIKNLIEFEDDEGRIICLEYEKFYLINVYIPNAGTDLKRLNFKIEWFESFFEKIKKIDNKHLIIVGDMNVAPYEIDIHNPIKNINSPGFTKKERSLYLKKTNKLIDVFRYLYPQKIQYTFFDKKSKAYARGYRGWRLDHILISLNLINNINDVIIHDDFYGCSDHVPIIFYVNL